MDKYAKQAKEIWGQTDAYKEYEEKNGKKSSDEMKDMGIQLMNIIVEFGTLKEKSATDPIVQSQVKKLQNFITEHYYTCTDEILSQLSIMYVCGGDFTTNINKAGGQGTAEFANEAIQAYVCKAD